MVHLITGYAGYEHIQSEDDGSFNAAFFGDGQYVMEIGNHFAGSIINNNTVRILDGDGLMYGRHFRMKPNVYEDLNIKTGTAGTNRIDLICLTYKKNPSDETETVYLEVIEGTETAGTPSAPAHINGNILDGASFNQMPLYRVVIEGVVLSEIEAVFDTIPSYEGLARMYADRFEAACEELKASFTLDNILKRTDVVDNLLSTSTDLPLSAKQGKELKSLLDSHSHEISDVSNLQSTLSEKQGKIARTVASGKSVTAPDMTIAQIASISLTKGTYLVLGSAYITGWDITKSGERKICISTSANSFNNNAGGNALATEDMSTSVNCWALLTLTATTTVYLLGYQASGLSQTISNGNLCALKLE